MNAECSKQYPAQSVNGAIDTSTFERFLFHPHSLIIIQRIGFPQHFENIIILSSGIIFLWKERNHFCWLWCSTVFWGGGGFFCFVLFLRLWMSLRFLLPAVVHWHSMMFLGVDYLFTNPVQHLLCFFKLRIHDFQSYKISHFLFEACLSIFSTFSSPRTPVLCVFDNFIT